MTACPASHVPSRRYFVGLRPDLCSTRRLATLAGELAARCRGRPLAAADLHLTLAFVGELSPDAVPVLRNRFGPRCAPLALLAQPLTLDRIDRFGPALLWIGPSKPTGWLDELACRVRATLDEAQIGYDRRGFRAHLTLLRNARDRTAVIEATRAPAPSLRVARWRLAIGWSAAGPEAGTRPVHRYRWQPLSTAG